MIIIGHYWLITDYYWLSTIAINIATIIVQPWCVIIDSHMLIMGELWLTVANNGELLFDHYWLLSNGWALAIKGIRG